MKSINGLGLAGLLAGALSIGVLASPQESYADHKGELKVEINEEGYSIRLLDKTMQKGFKAIFLYRENTGRASLAFLIKDNVTGIITSYLMEKYNLNPFLLVESVKPDTVSIPNNNCRRKNEPSTDEVNMWKGYLKALHQEETQRKWHDKYYRRKK
ncbi:hypothetical protein HYX17_05225 [Candidatus Woesearchaeota archaeon]|nr:hypothetical protein [Candidatus Woesearchaeota archaeon]